MQTGIVLSIDRDMATVVNPSGAFLTLRARPGWQVGDVVSLPRVKRRYPAKLAAACACLALLCAIGFGGYRLYITPSALVSLDVNPALELTLNRFGRVVGAEGYNPPGQDLAQALDLRHLTCEDALYALVTSGALDPYLQGQAYVSLTVSSRDGRQQTRLLETLEQASEEIRARQSAALVECHAVDQALVEQAHAHRVTAGKYLALLELQTADPQLSLEDYAHCSIAEIKEQTQACQRYGQIADGESEKGHHGACHHR